MKEIQLELYVTGDTPRSEQAIANLHRICRDKLNTNQVQIIDVLEQPDLAEKNKIIATPTLVKIIPPPARRVIGDLSDVGKVIKMLGLQTRSQASER
jgi:circadian clock protein KaiB